MEQICGKQPGTIVYVYNDYTYNTDSRNKNILRCNTRRSSKCPGSVYIDKDNKIHLIHGHNHIEAQDKIKQSIMRQEMLKLCRETHLPLKEIFDNVCRKYSETAIRLSYATMKSTLYRERIKLCPSLPKNMETLAENLLTYVPLEGFYKGSITCSDGKKAFIFTNNELLQEMQKSTELYVDGTFSIVPRTPLMSQMYSIHTRYMNVGIGMIFILCESRSSNMYTAIWKKIAELVPTLQQNIKFIMSDYEAAAMKVISEQIPTAETHGCWFHFNQALLRRWRRLGLTDASRSILCMTMTMALIPSNYFEKALSIIQLEVNKISSEYPAVNDFLAYVRNTWLPLASKVSVYDCPARTNNITESFHNVASKKFGKAHGNVWNFLDTLRKLIIDEEIKLKRLQTNKVCGGRTTITNRRRNYEILKAQQDFLFGRLNLEHFLRMFADRCKNMLKTDLLYKESNSHIHNSTSDEESAPCVSCVTKSNILHNIETDKVNEATITPLQDLFNQAENNNSRMTRQKKRKLLSIDKENSCEENKNAHKKSIDFNKLPKLSVVLHKIDEPLKKYYKNRI